MPTATVADLGQRVKAKHPGVYDKFSDAEVGERLAGWAEMQGFGLERTTIELRGVCKGCRAAG